MSWDFEAATLLKTGVQVFQYWYEETNAILNNQKKMQRTIWQYLAAMQTTSNKIWKK